MMVKLLTKLIASSSKVYTIPLCSQVYPIQYLGLAVFLNPCQLLVYETLIGKLFVVWRGIINYFSERRKII